MGAADATQGPVLCKGVRDRKEGSEMMRSMCVVAYNPLTSQLCNHYRLDPCITQLSI